MKPDIEALRELREKPISLDSQPPPDEVFTFIFIELMKPVKWEKN